MKNKIPFFVLMLFSLFAAIVYPQNGQSLIKEDAPQVYFNCGLCDMNYIKEQIPVVNYVNDRKDADIYVLFTSQNTGSGGKEYILYFIGENMFAGLKDTIKYTTGQTDGDDLKRNKMVKALKMGLVRYIARSKVSSEMNITFEKPKTKTEELKDDWDFWLFKTSLYSNFSGDKNYKYLYLNGTITANRTTEDLKLNFSITLNYNQNKYSYESNGVTTDILSITRNQYFNTYMVKSINERWSWGVWGGLNSSVYNNISFRAFIGPGIEYNIFPYSVSNERQLRISYKLQHIYDKYVDETLYFKTKDDLWSQTLNISLTLIKPWGSMNISSLVYDYLHDLKLYEIGVNGSVSLNLFKGFALSFYGGYFKIEDQITLRRAGATLEDVLTQRRQLETTYNFFGGFGISFSFGSIYNNIVNPRFGNPGGNSMTISF